MAIIGEIKKITIGGNTYTIPAYDLPIASSSTLGGVKVGSGLSINSTTGVLSASITETDPVFSVSAAAGITATDISNWNGKSSTDTKNTAGSTNSTSTLYLIGATSQDANPQTYSNKNLHFTIDSDTAVLTIGSSQISQYDINQAIIKLSGNNNLSANYVTIQPDTITAARTLTLPDKTGTVALTSDIPTKTSDLTNDSGFITTYTDEKLKWTASTSSNTYYPLQSTSTATTSTANTLNGISFYQYYNTAGGYRRLDLGNATGWKSSGGAYGTIRLYGAAATYYGDLVPGVLGTTSGDGHISANRTWTLPDKTGTIALTSDIPTVGFNNIQSNSATISLGNTGYTFLRSYTETDPVFSASAAAGITSSDITSWNGKIDTAGTGLSKSGTTLNHSNSVTAQTTSAVYPIKIDAQGHISEYGSAVTIPSAITNGYTNDPTSGNVLLYGSNSSSSTISSTKTTAALNLTANNGVATLYVGKAHSSEGSSGSIALSNTASSNKAYTTIVPSGTESRTITLPNATGTVALTSDIPTIKRNCWYIRG